MKYHPQWVLSAIGLGYTLDFILLLDGIAVWRTLCSIDKFISKTFRNRLDVPECALSGACCQEIDCLVHPPQGGDIDGLAPHNTSRPNPSSIFPRPTEKYKSHVNSWSWTIPKVERLMLCYHESEDMQPSTCFQSATSLRIVEGMMCSTRLTPQIYDIWVNQDYGYTHLLMIASTMIWIGLASVRRWMISMACLTMRTAMSFLPLLRPCIIRELVSLSTMGHWALRNRFTEYLPAVWGTYVACFPGVIAI